MDFIKDIINIYMRKFLQLEDLKWDFKEGLQIEHLKINSRGINEQFQEKNIPLKVDHGSLDSVKISYSPTEGVFHVHIREIQTQIRPQVFSTVGRKIQQGLVNIILDEDPVEFIDSYSYIRDLPVSYLEQTKKRVESTVVDPNLIPDPPKYPVAAYKLNNQIYERKHYSPTFYPPPLLDSNRYDLRRMRLENRNFVDSTFPSNPPIPNNKTQVYSTPIFKTNKVEGRNLGFYSYC